MRPRKIKIAQIGTSVYTHGCEIFNALKNDSENFDVVGYAFPENEREKFPNAMPNFDGSREMTAEEILNNPEIEAVAIETEEKYITKYAALAAKNGKHIHMEKPGGTELADFEELIKTVRKNSVVFHVGYMYRYNPVIKKIIHDAKSGKFGEIISVEAQMGGRHNDVLREYLKNYKGGMMYYLGCHLIDLILQIQGKPKNIITINKQTGMNGIFSDDCTMAVFEYDNGVSFAKACDVENGGFMRRQLVVTGTEKTIEIRPLEYSDTGFLYPKMITRFRECTSDDWNDDGTCGSTDIFDRYADMLASFAGMVRGETINPNSYDYELELYKTIHRCCNIK